MTDLQALTLENLTPDTLINLNSLTLEQQADLRLAAYYLREYQQGYQPSSAGSKFEQVQGYLEAFHHLSNLSAWTAAAQLLQNSIPSGPSSSLAASRLAPTSKSTPPEPEATTAKPFYKQLGWWGYHHQQQELCEQVFGKVDAATDCLCLGSLAQASRNLGQFKAALEYGQQQLELARQLEDQQAELMALGEIGKNYTYLQQFKAAIGYYQQQLALARRLEDPVQECLALANLGYIYSTRLHSRKGVKYLHQANTLVQTLNDPGLAGEIVTYLGQAYLFTSQYQQAIRYLKCHSDMDGISFQSRILALSHLALAHYLGLGQPSEAECYFKQALELCQERSNRYVEITILNNLSAVYNHGLKKPALAIPLLKKALRYLKTMQLPQMAVFFANLCNSYIYLGDHQQAQYYADAALANLKSNHTPAEQAIVLATLGNACWYQGRYLRAIGLVVKGLWILPPWRDPNGHLILNTFVREVRKLVQRRFEWQRTREEKANG